MTAKMRQNMRKKSERTGTKVKRTTRKKIYVEKRTYRMRSYVRRLVSSTLENLLPKTCHCDIDCYHSGRGDVRRELKLLS